MGTLPKRSAVIPVSGLLFCAGAATVMWVAAHRDVERLGDWQAAGSTLYHTIRGSNLVWISRDDPPRTIALRRRPLAGGSARTLAQAPLKGATPTLLAVTESGVYILEERPVPTPPQSTRQGGYGSMVALPKLPYRSAGRLSWSRYSALFPGMVRRTPAPQSDYRVRFLSLADGAAREVPSALNGRRDSHWRPLLVGSMAYWIGGPPDDPPQYVGKWVDANGRWPQYRYGPQRRRGILMSAPLEGGGARAVVRGVPHTLLSQVGEGVGWNDITPATGPPVLQYRGAELAGGDVIRAEPDGRLVRLRGAAIFTHSVTAYAGNRCYTISQALYRPIIEGRQGSPVAPPRLVSDRLDGSASRLNVPLPLDSDGQVTSLTADRDHLYAVLDEPAEKGDARARWLIRIRPGPPPTIDRITRFDTGRIVGFDDDYCYFTRTETQENWFDWSVKGLAQKTEEILCRVRLPQ